jgi:hypothetical protein
MSRTIRTMPRWVRNQIIHTNDLVNGYRGVEYSYYGSMVDYVKVNGVTYGKPYRGGKRGGNTDVKNNELNAWCFSSDNSKRYLRNCRNSCEIGKMCGGWTMGEACTQAQKKFYRKVWARSNRRLGVKLIQDELDDFYNDDGPYNKYDVDYIDESTDEYDWDMVKVDYDGPLASAA